MWCVEEWGMACWCVHVDSHHPRHTYKKRPFMRCSCHRACTCFPLSRFEEEETATAMSSQPYLRHDVVVSGEDASDEENDADLFDDG